MNLKIKVKKTSLYLVFVRDKIFASQLINKSCQLTFVLFLILSFLSIEIFKAIDSKAKFEVSHNGFDILVQGKFENSGQNLYVSKSGRIQFIRHWDLNYDGYHDLVFNTTHNRMDLVDTFIYLQKNQNFKSAIPPLYDSLPLYEKWKYIEDTKDSLLRIAGVRPISLKVHDLDHDGYPEILLANTTNGFTRNSESFLYWGSSKGYRKKTELPTAIAQDVCIADLNGNGYSEIIFANLGIGDHKLAEPKNSFSSIYWGSRSGFNSNKRTLLPAPGPHWTQNVDIGNLMNRKTKESYISVPIQIPSGIIRITIEHEASTPLNSRIDWSVRTSSEKHILDHSEWKNYTSQSALDLSPKERWLQYRATLVAGKGSMTPYLTAIKIRETETK